MAADEPGAAGYERSSRHAGSVLSCGIRSMSVARSSAVGASQARGYCRISLQSKADSKTE
jgi:hypothetical protein